MRTTTIDMHEDITEHVSYDRGYNQGYDAGMKRAWNLMGELAEYYKRQTSADHLMEDEDSGRAHGRLQAALYAQMVIKKDMV